MADAQVTVTDGKTQVAVFGADLLAPLIAQVTGEADAVTAAAAAAVTDIGAAKTDALSDIGTAKTAALDDIGAAKTGALDDIETAKGDALSDIADGVTEVENLIATVPRAVNASPARGIEATVDAYLIPPLTPPKVLPFRTVSAVIDKLSDLKYLFSPSRLSQVDRYLIPSGATASYAAPSILYERDIVTATGQSLMEGYQATPARSTTQLYNSTMLSSGVRTRLTSPYSGQTLVPLVEAVVSGNGETPCSGAGQMIMQLLSQENGLSVATHSFELAFVNPSEGGTSITSHVKGTTNYTNALAAVSRIVDISTAENKPVASRSVLMAIGESDTISGMSSATFVGHLSGYLTDWTADVSALTGQSEPIELISYQTSAHSFWGMNPTIAMAQLAAAASNPRIHIAAPVYMMDTVDGVHLPTSDSQWLGAYLGLVRKRVVEDGKTWLPLKPKAKRSRGSAVDVIFDVPVPPLRFDTVQVVDPGNYGFALVDSGGSPLTISSVTLAGPDRVRIVAAATLPAGFKVRYAWGPGGTYNAGRITGPRGCLRDSQGDRLIHAATGRRMHNWCLISEI